jgi:hypothetical protein
MNRRVLTKNLILYRLLDPSDMISPLLLTRITWKDRSFCIERPVECLGMIPKISSPTPEALANPTPGIGPAVTMVGGQISLADSLQTAISGCSPVWWSVTTTQKSILMPPDPPLLDLRDLPENLPYLPE